MDTDWNFPQKPVPLACRLPLPLSWLYFQWSRVAYHLVQRMPLEPRWLWFWALPAAGVWAHSDCFRDWHDGNRKWRQEHARRPVDPRPE